jgi:hypothetical protein
LPDEWPADGGGVMNDYDEWRWAVNDLSEMERARYDEPQEYDTMTPDGVRL